VIELSVNGKTRLVEEKTTVQQLVELIGCGERGVAVAVNSAVVPKSLWVDTALAAGDRVEVLSAAQGG
jgi:sulfur carrier protein